MTSSVLREPPGVRDRVRASGPPKARLRTTSGMGMMPMTSPEGASTQMPPEPTHHTRPAVSTLRPSGTPGAAEDMSQKTRLLLKRPSGATSKARIRRWVQTAPRASSSKQRSSSRLIATYRRDSSGENASPLGYSHASVARWTWPWGSIRNTPAKPISRCAAGRLSSGSVKKRLPSERQTTSFGLLNRLPCQRSAMVVTVPAASIRVIHRWSAPSHMMRRPCRSSVQPWPSPVCSRTTVTALSAGSQRNSRLPARSTQVTYPPACHSGPSVRPQPVVSRVGSIAVRTWDRDAAMVDLLPGCFLGYRWAHVASPFQGEHTIVTCLQIDIFDIGSCRVNALHVDFIALFRRGLLRVLAGDVDKRTRGAHGHQAVPHAFVNKGHLTWLDDKRCGMVIVKGRGTRIGARTVWGRGDHQDHRALHRDERLVIRKMDRQLGDLVGVGTSPHLEHFHGHTTVVGVGVD